MPILNLSKTQLALACVTGGSCVAGVPVALYFNQGETSESAQETVTEQTQPAPVNGVTQPVTNSENELGQTQPLGDVIDESAQLKEIQKRKNNEEAEKLWQQIEVGYKNSQSSEERKLQGLSWKDELKTIWDSEEVKEVEWRITKQEWKDCRAVGGQDAYCGYLELERGSDKYRLRVDKHDSRQNSKEWDVFVIKADGRKIKWYDQTQKVWKTENHEINKFGGASKMANNWWVKLANSSISKAKQLT